MDTKHIIVLIMLAITFAVLLAGIGLMMVGGKLNQKYGNKLMVARVAMQGITILLIGALFMMGK